MTTLSTPPRKFVELPLAPKTTSPVPSLTSIYSTTKRGPYGDAKYPGNCSGYLIRDLLTFFGSKKILDPMTGSGTCQDVCEELGIPCHSFDVRSGVDAADPKCYADLEPVDFVWLHPPYWRMKRYSDDPRCLSNAPTFEDFCERLRQVVANCQSVLTPRGKIAILMGDYWDVSERRFIPCTHATRSICFELGLWPACTEIIRFQHGNSSSTKSYDRAFIPGLHDTCIVMSRPVDRRRC
ncbi:MAG: hypothetical protein U1D30_06795 [Planctomycetota bacterium]